MGAVGSIELMVAMADKAIATFNFETVILALFHNRLWFETALTYRK